MSWFVPPNCTDVVQVVDDARVGKVLKDLVREERDAYIEAAGWKEYESLDAAAKRVMFSHFAGEAWRRYTEEDKYKKMLHESFLAKGFLWMARWISISTWGRAWKASPFRRYAGRVGGQVECCRGHQRLTTG